MAEICDKIKKCLDPIIAQFRYLFRYNNFIQSLRGKNEELNCIRNDLQVWIQVAEDNLVKIEPGVDDWCIKAGELKEKTDRILGDEPRVQNDTCLQGTTCPNLKLRHSHSREAEKLTADIVELLNEYLKFGSHKSYPAPVEPIPATSNALEFDSRRRIEEEILSYMRDDSISMIGVCGMGGVGKTTMAKKLEKRAIEEKLDKTVMAVVSQQVDLWKIQQQLAEGLGLHLTQETVSIRASQLRARLKDKNVLIIFDDVWEPLKLEELGIPPRTKILLTTRIPYVCRQMSIEGATKILELGVLNEEEAFFLFRENAGHVVNQSNLRPLAMGVTKECKGLPLALVTVGLSLKGEKEERIWRASLGQLKKAAPGYIEGYLEHVWQPLKLSYDKLEDRKVQYLFLLCCLFPEDSEIEIDNLVRYGVGLSIFSDGSINDARQKVDLLVKRLMSRCLLMGDGRESLPRYVKMHDVIRDMALFIASSGEHVFKVSHDKDLKEWPCENYTCISLSLGDAKIFPEDRHWPGLKALLLTFDLSATPPPELPINFLNGMKDLTLLSIDGGHWSRDHVFRLPLSFLSSLTKLRVLHLHRCGLEDISLIGQLKDLEILSCRGSDIQILPDEIGALKKLNLLDMTACRELENIAPGVFSALKQLEELRLMGCPIKWECEEEGDERRNASLTQVFSLENLTLLEIWIQDLEAIFQTMGDKQNLKKYSIVIGRQMDEDAVVLARSLKINGVSSNFKVFDFPIDEINK